VRNPNRTPLRHIRRRALVLLAAALALVSCGVTPFQRTLPDRVRRVYVPIAVNKTVEPGLEEIVTRGFQEEILRDGRLDLVQKGKADAVVKVTILEYGETSASFTPDNVESSRRITLAASIDLYEPNDLENPFAGVPRVIVSQVYGSNYRSVGSTLGVDARTALGHVAGGVLLNGLMNQVKLVNE
jgi:hypothetical protein